MRRTSRRSSEDHVASRKHRRGSSSSRSVTPGTYSFNDDNYCFVLDRRRRDSRDYNKKDSRNGPRNERLRRSRSRSYSSRSRSESPPHVTTRRMSMQKQEHAAVHGNAVNPLQNDNMKNEGDFDNYPEITQKTREGLKARGINFLFPV